MCLLLRCLRFPPRLPVCRSCLATPRRASPGLASPIHTCRAYPVHAHLRLAAPSRACPSSPGLARPSLAAPVHACHTTPHPASPRQAPPHLPRRTLPSLSYPGRAMPRLPCIISRAPLSPPRCLRAASGAGSAFSARSAGPAHPPPRLREGPRASPHPPRADTGFRCLRRFGPRTD